MDFSKLTACLNTLEEAYGAPGLDIKITQGHETVYRKMIGHSDYARTKPVSGRDLYNIYSASKLITMTGVMQLVEQGRLGLEDPLEKYLPEFASMRYAADFKVGEFPFRWPDEQSDPALAQNKMYIRDLAYEAIRP